MEGNISSIRKICFLYVFLNKLLGSSSGMDNAEFVYVFF